MPQNPTNTEEFAEAKDKGKALAQQEPENDPMADDDEDDDDSSDDEEEVSQEAKPGDIHEYVH